MAENKGKPAEEIQTQRPASGGSAIISGPAGLKMRRRSGESREQTWKAATRKLAAPGKLG